MRDKLFEVLNFCKCWYDDKTIDHCVRVAIYARENPCVVNDREMGIYMILALCHDLLEDTDCTLEEIVEVTGYDDIITKSMLLLTQGECETYPEYIARLKASDDKYAYVVKLADMKDHLAKKDTLTDKLREKYWEALPKLL